MRYETMNEEYRARAYGQYYALCEESEHRRLTPGEEKFVRDYDWLIVNYGEAFAQGLESIDENSRRVYLELK